MIQVYGHFNNYYSFSNVTRAWCKEMRKNRLNFNVFAVNEFQGYQYLNTPWETGLSEAPVGILFDYPSRAKALLHNHDFTVLVTACETNKIPQPWIDVCNEIDLIVVPSHFCRNAFVNSGVRSEVIVVRHGSDNKVEPLSESDPFMRMVTSSKLSPEFKLLHVHGSLSYPQRKGFPQLLRALSEVDLNIKVTVITQFTKGLENVLTEFDLFDKVEVVSPAIGLHPILMEKYLKTFDGVIQPSRGEAFGMVPLEARCAGVPSILTNCSGHTEHFAACDTLVETGEEKWMGTKDNDAGRAPTLNSTDVAISLHNFWEQSIEKRWETRKWAKEYGEHWSWSSVLHYGMKRIRQAVKETRKIHGFASSRLGG